MAKETKELSIAEQCLCNAGIASGNSMIEKKKEMINTFYKTSGFGFGNNMAGFAQEEEDWSDEEGAIEYQDAPNKGDADSF